MPVIGRELVCDTKGISEAFWQGNEAISVEYKFSYKFRFITGKNPKSAYFDRDKKQWVWNKVSTVENNQGVVYYNTLTEAGFLSAVLSEDESFIIVNYLSNEVEEPNIHLGSYTELAKCTGKVK